MGKVLNDVVFSAVRAAREAKEKYGDKVIDATLGALYDEEGTMVAMDSVWDVYAKIPNFQKAKYASDLQGNMEFRESVKKWLKIDDAEVVATPGGSGAISITFRNSLEQGETLLLPNVCWGPYKVMAGDQNLNFEFYELFDGDSFNLDSFKSQSEAIMNKQNKLTVVLNDPAHNPTGYSMSKDEWKEVMSFLNELANKGKIVLLNDVAYIDFTKNVETSRAHFDLFDDLHDNLTVVVSFSISKTLTAYGLRVGAAVILGKEKQDFKDACVFSARGIWSNVNNSGMVLFSDIVTNEENLSNYLKEKDIYVKMLKERSDIFLKEAKEVGLDIFPHVEGFFATVKVDSEYRNEVHKKLDENLIFTINLPNGPRIALCSVTIAKCTGLAKKIKDIVDEVTK
ncbi:aminotransferase class I/II-fold pyridoxal phosphate-dependent enzyme [Mycoplasmatota bacterium WC44]